MAPLELAPPRRRRTPPAPPKEITVETESGKAFEIIERPPQPTQKQAEAAERRRSRDDILGATSNAYVKGAARRGRPRAGERPGPRAGSLRHIQEVTGGEVKKDAVSRKRAQIDATDDLRDRRRENGSEKNLTDGQLHAILVLIYDGFMKHDFTDYDKVKEFARLVQTDPDVAKVLDAEAVDVAWEPSTAWIQQYLAKWRIGKHKAQAKESSRSRPTMKAEEAQVSYNYSKFPGWRLVIQDETSVVWGAAPYHTLAAADGTGAQMTSLDKWAKIRTSLVLAARMTEDREWQLLTPVFIHSHDSLTANRNCVLDARDKDACECEARKVRGLHAGMWHHIIENVWIGGKELEAGDALVLDRLGCHHDLTTRRLLFKEGIWQLSLPSKSAAKRSPLDNAFFAVFKARVSLSTVYCLLCTVYCLHVLCTAYILASECFRLHTTSPTATTTAV